MTRSDPSRRAFTLVELVLVMILLCVIFGLAAPSLSRSMHARSLTDQATRLLALTDYARDEAASRGVPMDVWIDEDSGQYGVRAKAGFGNSYAREKQYSLPTGMHFDESTAPMSTSNNSSSNHTSGGGFTGSSNGGFSGGGSTATTTGSSGYVVEFAPDGVLDPASASSVSIIDQLNSTISIEQTNDNTEYEIVKDTGNR